MRGLRRISAFLALLLGVCLAAGAGAMYPDDHWSYSTKLTTSNFDDVVKSAVDGGRTLFVKWIASEG